MVFLRVLFSFEFGVVCVVPVPYLFHEQSTCKVQSEEETKKNQEERHNQQQHIMNASKHT